MPISFLRSGILDCTRRRYLVSLDSRHLQYNPVLTYGESRRRKPSDPASYLTGFYYNNTGRPILDRFELQLQLTFWMGRDLDMHTLHLLHCCIVIQLAGHLASLSGQHHSVVSQLYGLDHPLLFYRSRFHSRFFGPTIYHWNLYRFYELLTRRLTRIPVYDYTPQRKSILATLSC